MFFKIGVLKNFTNSQETSELESNFSNIAGLTCNFMKKRLKHRCFPVKFANFLSTLFLQNTFSVCLYVYQVDPCFEN